MDLDTNKDGKVDLIEGIAFVQGFMSATVADTLRVATAVSSVLVLALTLWNATHPAAAVAIPTTGPVPVPALPDAPVAPEAPADTDAAPVAPVAPVVAPVGGAS